MLALLQGNAPGPKAITGAGGSETRMADEQSPVELNEQQEIVRRYALGLRQAATGPRRAAEPCIRRCYELLNQCAMELAELNRRPGGNSVVVH